MTAPWLEELQSAPVIRPRRWAEISSMPASTVYDAIKRGDLPSIHLGSAIYIPTQPLCDLLGIAIAQEDEQ
jgi:hypothetical protein